MKYPRALLKTLAILGPMAAALSSYATEPAQAWDSSYDWCNNYYDPNCAYPYPYGFFFFGDADDRRFHHRFDRDFDHHHDFDHHFDHGGFNHGGFGHGGFGHGGMHGGSGIMMGHGGGHGGGHR